MLKYDPRLIDLFSSFKSPADIQTFLNGLAYSTDYGCRSPLGVAVDKAAHCSEGAFFAAAALRYLGYKPLVIILYAKNDDDHLIAPFKKNGHYGCIAKSNTTMLRYREPVYKTIRELIMSFFDMYFNTKMVKSLRQYSKTIDMERFDRYDWMHAQNLDFIWDILEEIKKYDILDKKDARRIIRGLRLADKDLMDACFMGSVQDGLFKPE